MLTRWLQRILTRFYCQKQIFGYFPIEIPIKDYKKLWTAEGMFIEQKQKLV